jgi:hypothetical protein
MQINLFDCKSELPLRRGLGRNKLNLCMLVISQLRETYWSASVIHRLFDRAQDIIGRSHLSNSNHLEKKKVSYNVDSSHDLEKLGSLRNSFQFNSQDIATSQHPHLQSDYQPQEQQLEEYREPLRQMLESNLSDNEQQSQSWLNESMFFGNVDHLLSPSFVISENAYQSFLAGYDSSMRGYDHSMPVSGEVLVEGVYNP